MKPEGLLAGTRGVLGLHGGLGSPACGLGLCGLPLTPFNSVGASLFILY